MKKNKPWDGKVKPHPFHKIGWFAFAIALFSLTPETSSAQNSLSKSVSLSVFNERIGAPFSPRNGSPLHPGIALSYERSKLRSGKYQFSHVIQLGYYHHQNFNQAFFLAWKPKFEWRFRNLVNVHAIPGIGYGHSFPTQVTYVLEEGSYVKKPNRGKPHLVPSLGLGTGFHFDKLIEIPLELFLRYEIFSLAPYSPKGTVPFTLNTMFSLGLRYQFNR